MNLQSKNCDGCEFSCTKGGFACKECLKLLPPSDFYTYSHTGKLYKKCISCYNAKVECKCGKRISRSNLNKHLKICVQKKKQNKVNDIIDNTEDTNDIIKNDTIDADTNHELNRTLIVGPSFCGKTYLLLNKLELTCLDKPDQQIKIITRSPEQYTGLRNQNLDLENYTVEEDLGDRTLEDFQNCCVVFDDMLDSNQKLIDPFFTRGRHNDLDVYYLSQSYFDLPKRTIRNNSNIIILFQQTLKDVENIYRDIAGFDMSYDEFKSLCREAWKEKYNYLEINRLEDKNGKKYKICNESNMKCKIFNPATDPF